MLASQPASLEHAPGSVVTMETARAQVSLLLRGSGPPEPDRATLPPGTVLRGALPALTAREQ